MIAGTHRSALVQHVPDAPARIVAKWPQGEPVDAALSGAAEQVLSKGRTHLAKSTEDTVVLGQPVHLDGELWGAVVLQIAQRNQRDMAAALKLLKWGMTWLHFLLHHFSSNSLAGSLPEPLPRPEETAALSSMAASSPLMNLLTSVLKENSLREAAITTVNQLSTLLQSQRVSLAFFSKQQLVLQAVSFSANFDARTPAMQLVLQAMTETAGQHKDIHYPEDAEQAELEIWHHHHSLLEETGAASLHSLLLRHSKQLLGVVTIEADAEHPLSEADRGFLDQSLPILASVLSLKQQAEAGVGARLKSAMLSRTQRWWGGERWLGKVVTATVLAAILLLLMPTTYWVQGDAFLQSMDKRVLVANQDGYLASVAARPGDLVTNGAVLAEMNDDDLRLERRKLGSQLQQFQQEYDNALATYARAEATIAAAQVEQARIQLELIEQQLQRTQLTAPMDGIIVSGDISQSVGAPVKQGDVLFEIAAPGQYRAVLHIDERDITHIEPQQTGQLVLTSAPERAFAVVVSRVTPLSEARDGRNYFRVEAQLLATDETLRPGMTGSGKIDVGRRALGWIWFHDMIDWFRLALWL